MKKYVDYYYSSLNCEIAMKKYVDYYYSSLNCEIAMKKYVDYYYSSLNYEIAMKKYVAYYYFSLNCEIAMKKYVDYYPAFQLSREFKFVQVQLFFSILRSFLENLGNKEYFFKRVLYVI